MSYPFDWLGNCSIGFCGTVDFICSGWEGFLKKEDLVFVYEYQDIAAYKSVSTNVVFNHDFKKDIPFEEQFASVKEKYNRRVKRLLDNIRASKRILLVYIECLGDYSNSISIGSLKDSLQKLNDTFPGTSFSITYICNNEDRLNNDKYDFKNKIYYKYVSKNIELIKINNYLRHHCYLWKGNYPVILKILSKCRLRD
jgi:hypothetical protein